MINKNITFTSEELAVLNDIVKKYIDYYIRVRALKDLDEHIYDSVDDQL